jgi:hypothetical protein
MRLLWGAEDDLSGFPSWRLSPQPVSEPSIVAARALEFLELAGLLTALASLSVIVYSKRHRLESTVRAYPKTSALVLFVVLAIAETWPLAAHPGTLSRNTNADTVLNEWALAWVAHEAPRAPLRVFDGNIFYPERLTLAY